jgi:hypothetical protein
MSPRLNASRDVHVHISRLVIDRSVLDAGSVDQLKQQVIDRIAGRFGDRTADRGEAAAPWNPGDAIADAVSSQIESRVPNSESRITSRAERGR